MITWRNGIKGAIGEIVNEKDQSILIQTDWDTCSVANTFGWSIQEVQKCPQCSKMLERAHENVWYCDDCESSYTHCYHDATDGTVDCNDCKCKVSDFIQAASEYLSTHDGMTAEDPGYFYRKII